MASTSAFKLGFITVDVFTTTKYLGNPLAVVLVPAEHRTSLVQATKQRIAREFNLSETVFLHVPPPGEEKSTTREFDIFTIESELPFAGHPTIGTTYAVLHRLGWNHVDTLLAKAGPLRISTATGAGHGSARAQVPHAVHVHSRTLRDVLSPGHAQLGGLSDEEAIRSAELDAPVVSIVRGMTFVLVRLQSLEELGRVPLGKRLDFARLGGLLDEGEWAESFIARYYYVDNGTGSGADRKIQSRMVELGFEDPATGSAACTLASYLALSGATTPGSTAGNAVRFEITQGVEMGRKSDIEVEVVLEEAGPGSERQVKTLYLGGSAVVMMEGTIEV